MARHPQSPESTSLSRRHVAQQRLPAAVSGRRGRVIAPTEEAAVDEDARHGGRARQLAEEGL